MRCPEHPDQPSIACTDCDSEADERELLDEITVDMEMERVTRALSEADEALTTLRDAIELLQEAINRRDEA